MLIIFLVQRVRIELVAIMKTKSLGLVSEQPLGPTGKVSVYDSVLDSPVLPPAEKSLLRLQQEGALLVLAGTESPAKSLNIIFYHVLANPAILRKLRAELSTVAMPASWTQLEQLPYLSAVIEEGNRLSFGVTARSTRIAYEPLTYTPSAHVTFSSSAGQSYTLPAGTPISMTTLSSHTAESVFPDPFVFDPERWLGDAGRPRRKFQMAFGKGSRKCLGVELTRCELCLVTAWLVNAFDMRLWQTNDKDVAFMHDYQVAMAKMDSKGVRILADTL
jgi:cytochrome P450